MSRLPDKYDSIQDKNRPNGMLRTTALYSVSVSGFNVPLAPPTSTLDAVSNMTSPALGQLRNNTSSTWIAQVNFEACLDFSLNAGSFLVFTIRVNGVSTTVSSYVVSNNITAGNNTSLSGQISIPPNGDVQVDVYNAGAGSPITMRFYNFFLSVSGIRIV